MNMNKHELKMNSTVVYYKIANEWGYGSLYMKLVKQSFISANNIVKALENIYL